MASTPWELTLDTDDLSLEELAAAAREFSGLLGELDAAVSPDHQRTLRYRLTDLSYNSPAYIGGVAEPAEDAQDNGPVVLAMAVRTARAMELGGDGARSLPYEALEHLRNLARNPATRSVRIGAPTLDLSAVVTTHTAAAVEGILAKGDALASIEGQLDTVSVHSRPYCTVYDAVTQKGVRCFFPPGMRAEVVAALGAKVAIHGVLRRDASGRPREMKQVDRLDLLGRRQGPVPAPGLVGVLSALEGDTREYLAEIRGD